jgi:hypothetical protein
MRTRSEDADSPDRVLRDGESVRVSPLASASNMSSDI